MAELMTVNLNRCVNCGVCEMACAERHGGKARLKVKDVLQSRGLIFDDEALPIVCKQCENPTCIEVCKPNALVQQNGVIYVDEEKCIGLSLIHISEPTRRTPISYAVFCLKKKNTSAQNLN